MMMASRLSQTFVPIVLACLLWSKTAFGATVFRNLLTHEEVDAMIRERDHYRANYYQESHLPGAAQKTHASPNYNGIVSINGDIHERIRRALHPNRAEEVCTVTDAADGGRSCEPNTAIRVYTSNVINSTVLHTDYTLRPGDSKRPYEASFVFMNDNPDDYFLHDGVITPCEKGTFLAFDGTVPHRTMVHDPENNPIQLLGPFNWHYDHEKIWFG